MNYKIQYREIGAPKWSTLMTDYPTMWFARSTLKALMGPINAVHEFRIVDRDGMVIASEHDTPQKT